MNVREVTCHVSGDNNILLDVIEVKKKKRKFTLRPPRSRKAASCTTKNWSYVNGTLRSGSNKSSCWLIASSVFLAREK